MSFRSTTEIQTPILASEMDIPAKNYRGIFLVFTKNDQFLSSRDNNCSLKKNFENQTKFLLLESIDLATFCQVLCKTCRTSHVILVKTCKTTPCFEYKRPQSGDCLVNSAKKAIWAARVLSNLTKVV